MPPGAVSVPDSCWSYEKDYTCKQILNSCATYSSDANCKQTSPKTCTKDDKGDPLVDKDGLCLSFSTTYTCSNPNKPPITTTSTVSCDITDLQMGLNWTTTTPSASADFVAATTTQEFARQVVLYSTRDATTIDNLFPGDSFGCRTGSAGLRNCCKSASIGSASTNHDVAQNMGGAVALSALEYGAGYAIQQGSYYVFDSMMASGTYMADGMTAMVVDSGMMVGDGMMASGVGAFGFGTSASSAAGLFSTASASTPFASFGGTTLYFNPYALAAAVAIQIIMEAMTCNEEEKNLQKALSEGLCVEIGDYCSEKLMLLGEQVGCNETTTEYCCYNGKLGKAIQIGAHSQLGLSWGSPEAPDCSGMSIAELTAIDFNDPTMQAALVPFQQQIMNTYSKNTGAWMADGSYKNALNTNADAGAKALCLQRQKLEPSTVCN